MCETWYIFFCGWNAVWIWVPSRPFECHSEKKKEIGSLLRYLRCCWLSAQMAQQIEFHLLIILAFYFIFFPASFGSRPRTSSGEESQNKNTTVGSKNTSQNVTWFHWFGLYCPWEGAGWAERWENRWKSGRGRPAIYGPAEGEFNFCCRPNESFDSESEI